MVELLAQEAAVAPLDWRVLALTAVFSGVGYAVKWIWDELRKNRTATDEKKEAREKTIVDYQNGLIERLDREKEAIKAELALREEEIHELTMKENRCLIATARLDSHIRYLQSILERERIPFEAYEEPPDSGSKPHNPLPPGQNEGKTDGR